MAKRQWCTRTRWAVFISGTGSNLAALLDLRDTVDIAFVVSSKADAHGLLRARRSGIPALVLPKPVDWTLLDAELRRRRIDRIFLAGFMKLLPTEFVRRWKGRMLNIHPSLLPLYPGLDSIERAHADGKPLGCTVHGVNEEMDAGPRYLQRKVMGGNLSLPDSEFLAHLSEYRLVREALWKNVLMSS